MEESVVHDMQLQQCGTCGRSFKLESLAKHEGICKKVKQNRRPVFNSKKQREVPLPEDYKGPIKPVKTPTPTRNKPPSRKITPIKQKGAETFTINGTEYQRWPRPNKKNDEIQKWKEQVEDEFEIKRQKRVPSKTRSLDDAQLYAPSRTKSVNRNRRNMVECPHCMRTFVEGSADRHMKFCEEIHSRMPVYNDNWDAKWKLAMRTRYQPPTPKKRHDSETSSYTKKRQPPSRGRLSPLEVPPPKTPQKKRVVKKYAAPVIEEGISSRMPLDEINYSQPARLGRHDTFLPSVYNTQIEYADETPHSAYYRKPKSKMVTYGAVQPFSGPVIGKDALANRKTRFKNSEQSNSLIYPEEQPYVLETGAQADLALSYPQPDTASIKLQTDSPKHENQISNQLSVPQYQITPYYNVQTPYWNSAHSPYTIYSSAPWQPYRAPWIHSEDAYLQNAPRLLWPNPTPVLPDVVPRQTPRYIDYNHDYKSTTPSVYNDHYTHHPPASYRYHKSPPAPPSCRHEFRNLLTRDNTLLDDDHLFSPGGPQYHHPHSHKFCANCGSKFHTAASRYCQDCGAINELHI